jgi:biotin operon repressor
MALEGVRFRIVVRKVEQPFSEVAEDQLDWICKCLGFFEEIDREKTAASIFKELLSAAEQGKMLSSTELAGKVDMSRGSVLNHLNRLQKAGLVVKHGRGYSSRAKSLLRTIQEIEEDIDRVFRRLEESAKAIDRRYGIEITD